jgi:hypothetical protein
MKTRTLVAALMVAAGAGTALADADKKPETQQIALPGLKFTAPKSWTAQNPAGQFRVAQFQLPAVEGDERPPTLLVFHFGRGGAGSVEENLRRWAGMLEQPEGTDVRKVLKVSDQKREGMRIVSLDLPGTYLDRPFPMSNEVTKRPGYRMLGAIVEPEGEGGHGPYYFRLVGSAKSVEAQHKAWEGLLQSARLP